MKQIHSTTSYIISYHALLSVGMDCITTRIGLKYVTLQHHKKIRSYINSYDTGFYKKSFHD